MQSDANILGAGSIGLSPPARKESHSGAGGGAPQGEGVGTFTFISYFSGGSHTAPSQLCRDKTLMPVKMPLFMSMLRHFP